MRKCKKIIANLLLIIICLSSGSVCASFYTPGETTYKIDGFKLSSNQKKYHEFYLPFDSGSVTITYSASADVSLSLETGRNSITETFLSNETEKIIDFANVERKGEKAYTFTPSGAINITGITFNKYDNPQIANKSYKVREPALTEQEKAIQTSVLIHENSPVIVVNGGKRYVNVNDPAQTPAIIDGSIYLPARTLALALGCYYEDINDNEYLLIRNDELNKEFYFSTDDSYMQNARGEKTPISYRTVYRNGQAHIPVRFLAEAIGKKVVYKNGIIVINDKYSVENIVNTNIFDYVTGIFSGLVQVKKAGRTFHVAQSANANDSNDGSEDAPFKTLNRAATAATQPGDTVIIHKGTYREVLEPKYNGTVSSPIIFKAAENEKVVLSATESVSGFSNAGFGMISASIPWDLGNGRNQVFYNGECIIEARHPNKPTLDDPVGTELSPLFPIKGDFTVSTEDNTLVTSNTHLNQVQADYWKGATFVSMHGYGWTLCTAKIASSEKGKLHLDGESFADNWWYNASSADSFGYISGHINAIDKAGEWVIENGKLTMLPPSGTTASNLTVEVKKRQITIDLAERKYVQVIGVESFGGGARMNNSEMCVLNNVDMKYISHYTYSNDQREGFIDNGSDSDKKVNGQNGAPSRGEVGVYIGGRDNAVVNSSFDHSAASALYLTGLYAYIDNNEISNCGYMGSYVSGISAYSEPWKAMDTPRGGFAIYNNTISNAGRSLIVIQGNEMNWGTSMGNCVPFVPFEVAYNDLHNGMLFSRDTGIFYCYEMSCATDKRFSRIHNNYVYTTTRESIPYACGIYNDGNAIGLDYYNNIIFTTEPDTEITHSYLLLRKDNTTSRSEGNVFLKNPITGGVKSLKAEHFPFGKPFYAGSFKESNDYLLNYEKADETFNYYSATEATSTGCTKVDEEGATLCNNDGMLCFENVDFGTDGKNNLDIYFKADAYKVYQLYTIYIGDDISTAEKYETNVISTAESPERLDLVSTSIRKTNGVKNVYIKGKSGALSPKIIGISVNNNSGSKASHDGTSISAADFDSVYSRTSGNADPARVTSDGSEQYVRSTWPGTCLAYYNVKVAEDASVLAIRLASGNANHTVTFHAGSPDAAAFATFRANGSGFIVPETEYCDLTQKLPAGVYDIYVKFSVSYTSNFYSFGFLP